MTAELTEIVDLRVASHFHKICEHIPRFMITLVNF